MRGLVLVVVFAVSFVGFLAARAPLQPLVAAAPLAQNAITYERAYGTIWDGGVNGLRTQGQPVGDVTVQLRPLGLIRGEARADVRISGDVVNGRGQVSADLSRTVRIEDARVRVDLSQWGALHPRLRSPGASVFAQIDHLVAPVDRPCATAQGRLQSDALVDFRTDIEWSGPPLEGDIQCQDGALNLTLAGAQPGASINALAQIDADFAHTVRVELRTDDDQVGIFARSFGFEEAQGVYTYTR